MSAAVPSRSCDVIMQGGITSGVVYPRALARFARDYRLQRLGGASAGAIGAALGAAAEHGRAAGGFAKLAALPAELGEGRLAALFQPTPATRPLLGLMLALSGHDAPGAAHTGAARGLRVLGALLRGWPLAAFLAALPGVAGLVLAVRLGGWLGAAVAVLALAALLLGVGAALGAASRTLTRDVPAQGFGVCTGLGQPGGGPGFTECLDARLSDLASLEPGTPLLHGHRWTGTTRAAHRVPDDRAVDLRMVSTCLTQARPYELPWDARTFFYSPQEWASIFPPAVLDALAAAPPGRGAPGPETAWEDARAAAASPALRRLPDPEHLPVVVSVRMSLSYPLLISAVPLWTIDRRSAETREAVRTFRAGRDDGPSPAFVPVWFSDGGLTSNFPVHLFDAALPTRPTFAINLFGRNRGGTPPPEEADTIEYSSTNAVIAPSYRPLPTTGWPAITGFVNAALATSREWSDAAQLSTPGMRDRVVRVLLAPDEGGLNLFMDAATIERLARRGEAAADVLVERFTTPDPSGATGWDNHRWVRYRALMAALPAWLAGYARGRAVVADLNPDAPPSYPLRVAGRRLAARLDAELRDAAAAAEDPSAAAGRADLTAAPRPLTVLRRVPQL